MSSLHSVSDGDIEEDNSGVRTQDFACEFGANEVSIEAQFFNAVGESESSRPSSEMPS